MEGNHEAHRMLVQAVLSQDEVLPRLTVVVKQQSGESWLW